MNSEARRRLERAGWRVGDAGDFLQLTEEERQSQAIDAVLGKPLRLQDVADALAHAERVRARGR